MSKRGPSLTRHAAERIRDHRIPYAAVRRTFLEPFATGEAPSGALFSVASVALGVRRAWLTLIRDADSDAVVTAYVGPPTWKRA